jgi:hypothetical protein
MGLLHEKDEEEIKKLKKRKIKLHIIGLLLDIIELQNQ